MSTSSAAPSIDPALRLPPGGLACNFGCGRKATRQCVRRVTGRNLICEECFAKAGSDQYLYVPPDGRVLPPEERERPRPLEPRCSVVAGCTFGPGHAGACRVDGGAPVSAPDLARLEEELASANRCNARQESTIRAYRRCMTDLAAIIGRDPGTGSEMVGAVEVEVERLRAALKEACEIAECWIGGDDPVCDEPAHRDCARVADLRKLTRSS